MSNADSLKDAAFEHAISLAKREKVPVVVYVSRHGSKEVWFVRQQREGIPTDAEAVAKIDADGSIVYPQAAKGNV